MGELVEFVPTYDVTFLSNDLDDDDDDEIYEKIEAPKFVDLTAPDKHFQVDDRSWFCLRAGCDLKHEEDMDPETLYKNFVLRVMAARSPNLRFRKTLSKQATSAKPKCPLSAPAKSSKRRLSRLTVVTSISQKLADAKVKVHPICKLNLTPKGKAKKSSIAAKALTTPRNKKCLPNQDPFRSVRNPITNAAPARNRLVAKALVFNSPKKTESRKTSLEDQTLVNDICSELKKLEINSKTNQSSKTSKSTARGPSKRLIASEPLKSKSSNQNLEKRVEVSRDGKDKKAKSLRRLKRKSKGGLRKSLRIVPQDGSVNDLSDMEIDEKSRKGSLAVCLVLGDFKSNEEQLSAVEENLGAVDAKQEEHLKSSVASQNKEDTSQAVVTDVASAVSSSEKDIEEKDPHELPTSDIVQEESNEGNKNEENVTSNFKLEELNLKENNVRMFGPTNRDEDEREEAIQSDDKENASTSEENRESTINDENSERNISQNENSENHQKVNGPVGKSLKGGYTVAANGGSPALKYKKTKPTNPKPFRLRTDERGILREAKLEGKLLLAPLREITPASKVADTDLQRRHENEIEQHEKSRRRENNSQERNQTETDKRTKKIQHRQVKSKYLDTLKCATEPKLTATTIRRRRKVEDAEDYAANKLEYRTTTKSQLLRDQLVRTRRVVGTRNPKISLITPGQLSVIKETSSTILRPKEAKPEKGGITSTTNPAGRSTSRGRRPTTVPKEPNFHRLHVPKGCIKTSTKVISS